MLNQLKLFLFYGSAGNSTTNYAATSRNSWSPTCAAAAGTSSIGINFVWLELLSVFYMLKYHILVSAMFDVWIGTLLVIIYIIEKWSCETINKMMQKMYFYVWYYGSSIGHAFSPQLLLADKTAYLVPSGSFTFSTLMKMCY